MAQLATHRRTALALVVLLGASGSARAQAPAPDGPAPIAEARPDRPTWRRLVLTAGGAFLRAHDDDESAALRGRFLLDAVFRPASWVEIALRYGDSLGPWEYVSSHPALGGGADRIRGFEHLHAIDLGARFDVPSAILGRPLPYHAWPYVGFGYLGMRSEVFDSQAIGGAIGLGLGYDLHRRTSIDASWTTLRAFANGGGEDAVYGPVEGIDAWSAGVSVGASDWSRLRIAYVGEALRRTHTTRESHGAQFTFQVSLL